MNDVTYDLRMNAIAPRYITFISNMTDVGRAEKKLEERGRILSRGLVPFAIGSETAGSICYPAARCGVTALRPTFGAVGRTGVTSISESLDKLGPFCRSASDCAIVLDAIRGKDPDDLSSRDIPLGDPFSIDVTKLTVGYLEGAEMEVVRALSSKGVNMVPFKLNYTVDTVQSILNFTMDVDMLTHFDEWQRARQDEIYEVQDQWPEELRRARLIPAVDYLQAQRARGKLIREVRESFTVDAFVGNATDWEKVCMGNLVGLPLIIIPTGFKNITDPPAGGTRRRTTIPTGIYAPSQHDHIALALAMAYQSVTNHHKQRPPISDLGPNDPVPIPKINKIAELFSSDRCPLSRKQPSVHSCVSLDDAMTVLFMYQLDFTFCAERPFNGHLHHQVYNIVAFWAGKSWGLKEYRSFQMGAF
ncbi:hypothetical protein ACLOJK_023807, partial [Asimina triloba]